MLEAVRGRIPTLLLTMEQSYCKLITQHFNLLVYKPDIANTHTPVEILFARIINNQGRVGTGGLHTAKTSQPRRPTQPIPLHHHRLSMQRTEKGRKHCPLKQKLYLQTSLPPLPSTHGSSETFYTVEYSCLLSALAFLGFRTPQSPGCFPTSLMILF